MLVPNRVLYRGVSLYAVIYAIFSRLNCCNSFTAYRVSLADSYTDGEKKKEIKKSEDRRFARFSNSLVWYFSDALQQS